MVDFSNTEIAFKSKSDGDLRRAWFLFKTVANPSFVEFGKGLVSLSLKLKLPVKWLIRKTVFNQFCGGVDIDDCKPVINQMHQFGVMSILDYSAEGNESEADFDKTVAITLETIRFGNVNKSVPLSVFKPTGVGRFALYEKVNSGEPLSTDEQAEWDRVRDRFYKIVKTAYDVNASVMVDAEESWIQAAIDELVRELMMAYNKERAVVYNTLQMYRWDRLQYLKDSFDHAAEHGYYLGVKLVRGAYMEKERARAVDKGYIDPIQLDKAATDSDYNDALDFVMARLDKMRLVAGTHNDESSRFLMQLLEKHNIAPSDRRVFFSQLFGMSDHLSFNLAAAGYNVVKYLPFGPVAEVMPYLFRRAEENTSVAGQTGRELALITKEIQRRRNAR
ncbi:MAG: proline dehydrogenase family protein [Schleiferiaceae bacterium]|nr:proline dehydrogenase family protein [Schleiferiaceae bacterium]